MARVTVLMPVYNGARFLKQSIESVLSQTYQDYELLCLDDASQDQSAEIIQGFHSPRIRYVRNEFNLGIAGSRNRGISLCQSEFIALLDHDDLTPPERLELEVRYLDEHLQTAAVGGNQKDIDEKGQIVRETWRVCHNPKYLKAFIMLSNTMANGSTMIRRDFVIKNNLHFRDDYYGVEDYRFWVDCSLKGELANIDEVLLYWRTGHDQETKRAKIEGGKRGEKIREIQRIALKKNGYCLSEKELDILFQCFGEDTVLRDEEEIHKLYGVFRIITQQAYTFHPENEKEVIAMCRKRFGEKVAKAFFLWEPINNLRRQPDEAF